MTKGILLVGEPMGLFIARNEGSLEETESFDLAVAGAEYNVAVGMSRLGHRVDYMTKLGNDILGRRILHSMQQNRIHQNCVSIEEIAPTGYMFKNKVSQGDPQVAYFRKGSAASTICPQDIEKIDFSHYSHVHITGILPALSSQSLAATYRLIEKARAAKLFISFDPNLRPTLWDNTQTMIETINHLASLSDLVLPGITEGKLLTQSDEPQAIARFYLEKGASAVVIKLGPAGAFVGTANQSFMVDGFPVEHIVDTVGAGDGFAVGVLSGLMEGLSLQEATEKGNAIGAMQVMCSGDNEGLPTPKQLTVFMNKEKTNELSI